MVNEYFDFADKEDVVKLCETLLQAVIKRMIWITDQADADHFQQSKIEHKLDDMEKVTTKIYLGSI